MTRIIAVSVVVLLGLAGFLGIGVISDNPCSSLARTIDQAESSPAYRQWLGFGCDRWPTISEALILEWIPSMAIIVVAGSVASRLSQPSSLRLAAIAGGLLAGLAYALRVLVLTTNTLGYAPTTRLLLIGAGVAGLGACLGYLGGRIAKAAA